MANTVPQLMVLLSRDSNRHPVSAATVPAWVKGTPGRRLIVILKASGCTYDLHPGGGCRYCGFRSLTTEGVKVESADLIAQFNWVIERHDCVAESALELNLFNSGSFLNDIELPVDARLTMLGNAAQLPGLKLVVIESRPEFITQASVATARRALHSNVALEVAIGLDAYDDHLREVVLRKGFTKQAFEAAVTRLAKEGTDLLCYVMLKPWSMNDDEALKDAVLCAEYAHEVAVRRNVRCRIALEPTFVVPGTPLAAHYSNGLYQPPSLWLVREAVEQIGAFGTVHVGLWDEDLRPMAVPSACAKCQISLLNALQEFNFTQDRSFLRIEPCACARIEDGRR